MLHLLRGTTWWFDVQKLDNWQARLVGYLESYAVTGCPALAISVLGNLFESCVLPTLIKPQSRLLCLLTNGYLQGTRVWSQFWYSRFMNENKIGNYVVCYFWLSIGFLDFTSIVFSFFNAAIFDKNGKQQVLHVTELSNLKFSQFFSCWGLNANSESNRLNDSVKYRLIIYPFAVMRVNLKCVKAQTSIKRS